MTAWASTGIYGLDKILGDLKKGDNVVWQVDSIEDYVHFVNPYITKAIQDNRNIVYMRFAQHKPLIDQQSNVTIYTLNADSGFETFTKQVHNIIAEHGLETYYLFDCLSDLLSAWATDLMIGNFFMVTCPYLFELETITYFAILRNRHSFKTIARIRDTTQLLLDVYNFEGNFYVHPLKVWNRHSPTMFLPHKMKGQDFIPIISSMDAAKLFSHISQKGLDGSARILDHWDRLFMDSEKLLTKPSNTEEVTRNIEQICKIIIGREKRISSLAQKHFTLENLINIKSRLLGSGFIGGKAAGMLLAQKILLSDKSMDWEQYLEPHDSFYIGSDVFYTYIVENGWWKLFMKQKTPEDYFTAAELLKEKMLTGKFPEQIRERFQEMIEYFGQSPIIVRSSSLLEDSFGNAFAGKYESIFLANQGSPQQRHAQFEEAVRKIYASTMDENALTYRLQRGLAQQDEQMALLVQRVSGSYHNHHFFPDLAGVGISYNTFTWHPSLDPKAGMLRLVIGLGTRAVDRVEDDYPQIIALDKPLLRPYADSEDIKRFSQHRAEIIDTNQNSLTTLSSPELINELTFDIDLIATPDHQTEQRMNELGMKEKRAWILTFKKLLSETDFPTIMQRMLKTLENHYQYPIDVEFTTNFTKDSRFKINLLQCRPLQTKGLRANVQIPDNIEKNKILIKSHGYTMGGSISQPIKRMIYIEPKNYIAKTLSEKYEIARIVGKLNRQITNKETTPTMLIGPGRWGTTTPSLGVPVNFAEINNTSVIVEIAYEGGNLMPELSFGTHFFNDLVESDIFYIALFPQKQEVTFNEKLLSEMQNLLTDFVPEAEKYKDVIKVYENSEKNLQLICDVISQKIICLLP